MNSSAVLLELVRRVSVLWLSVLSPPGFSIIARRCSSARILSACVSAFLGAFQSGNEKFSQTPLSFCPSPASTSRRRYVTPVVTPFFHFSESAVCVVHRVSAVLSELCRNSEPIFHLFETSLSEV